MIPAPHLPLSQLPIPKHSETDDFGQHDTGSVHPFTHMSLLARVSPRMRIPFFLRVFVTSWALSNRYSRHLRVPRTIRHALRTNNHSLFQIGTKSKNTMDIIFVKSSANSRRDFARKFLGQQRQADLRPTCSLRLFRSSYCPHMFRSY